MHESDTGIPTPPVENNPPSPRRLTSITPWANGYCVVVVQEVNADGTRGRFLGCMLLTPEHPDDGPLMLLGEAMRQYELYCASQKK